MAQQKVRELAATLKNHGDRPARLTIRQALAWGVNEQFSNAETKLKLAANAKRFALFMEKHWPRIALKDDPPQKPNIRYFDELEPRHLRAYVSAMADGSAAVRFGRPLKPKSMRHYLDPVTATAKLLNIENPKLYRELKVRHRDIHQPLNLATFKGPSDAVGETTTPHGTMAGIAWLDPKMEPRMARIYPPPYLKFDREEDMRQAYRRFEPLTRAAGAATTAVPGLASAAQPKQLVEIGAAVSSTHVEEQR